MKKTILVALIAVAMLFAFTACDNSAPSEELMNPVVRIYQAEGNDVSYLVNEVPEFSDFVVMAQRLDGSTFQVSADEVTFKPAKTATAGMTSNVGTVTYDTTGDECTVVADVYAIEKTEIKYNSSSFDQYYQGYTSNDKKDGRLPNDVFNKGSYTVTVTYDTDKTRTLAADEYVVTALADTTTTTTATATIAVDLNKDGNADSSDTKYQATASNIVIVSDTLLSMTVEVAKDSSTGKTKEFIAGATSDATPVAANFVVTGRYESGKEAPISDATLSYTTALTGGKYPATGTFSVTATKGTITAAVNVAVTANYITKFDVQAPASAKVGETITATASSAQVTWAAAQSEVTSYTVISNPSTMPTNAIAGNMYAFSFSLQGYPEAGTVVKLIQCAASN